MTTVLFENNEVIKSEEIYNTIYNIVSRSEKERIPSHIIAMRMAEEKINQITEKHIHQIQELLDQKIKDLQEVK